VLVYEQCQCHELRLRNISYKRQQDLPIHYKGLALDGGYRIDLVIEEQVIVEIKSVEVILPIHEAQLLTYLRLGGWKIGLLINFHVPVLKFGIRRIVNRLNEPS
jgi:GxxExxY protein